MVRDAYPLPSMKKFSGSLGDAQGFSTLNANSGFWRIEIDKADWENTTFNSHHGLYQPTRMALGLKNTPATLQHVIDNMLSHAKQQFALVYLDDVFTSSKIPHEQWSRRIAETQSCASLRIASTIWVISWNLVDSKSLANSSHRAANIFETM